MDPAPYLCHTKTIDASQRHIRTALGVSSGSYRDSPPHQILGLIQGNAGVAGLWALSSSSLFFKHDKIYRGLDLPGIIPSDGIKKNNDGYVNDVDTYTGDMTNDILTADNVMTWLGTGVRNGLTSVTSLLNPSPSTSALPKSSASPASTVP